MRPLSACILTLCLSAVLQLTAANLLQTPAPQGPFHVEGNQLIDAHGLSFLIRGTQTTPFHLKSAGFDARSGNEFGPHSATSFSTIRLRYNMNAVHISVDVAEANEPGYFDQLQSLVASATQNDLLVILAATEPGVSLPSAKLLAYWERCAVVFKDSPNVIFDAFETHSGAGWDIWRSSMQKVVRTIRATGARQLVVLASWRDDSLFEGYDPQLLSRESNILYEVEPRYETTRTDQDRDAKFGFLANVAPVIANDWDLHLEQLAACRAIPSDPVAAGKVVLDNLAYFDAHQISWTVSSFEPGRLIQDTGRFFPTMLEAGIKCGEGASTQAGLGRIILSHMFGAHEGKLVVVNISGGVVLPRGGYSTVYGRIMAERDSAGSKPPPYHLGGLSVEVTDSANVTRPARINWAAAGWGSLNFIIPARSAIGPGRLTIRRADGTRDIAEIQIADTAPGIFTGLNCQGPAIGAFTQSSVGGRVLASAPIYSCKGDNCVTVAIPVAGKTITRVRLVANGFRNITSASQIVITVAGVRVPVLSYKPANDFGVDDVIIAIPESLRGIGETDLICHVNGILANAVRISIS
jgi:uncharacterized protein (TIGR03437 family)